MNADTTLTTSQWGDQIAVQARRRGIGEVVVVMFQDRTYSTLGVYAKRSSAWGRATSYLNGGGDYAWVVTVAQNGHAVVWAGPDTVLHVSR